MHNSLFNTDDVSKILHVGKSTVKRWTDEGKLKCFRTPGGHRKFRMESVQEFIHTYGYDVSFSSQLRSIEGSSDNTSVENMVGEPMMASAVEMQ